MRSRIVVGCFVAVMCEVALADVSDCNLRDCLKLQDSLNARIESLNPAPAPKLSDFARNSDGSIRNMNQWDAEAYCEKQGFRLPSAREFAYYSQSRGATGLIEYGDHKTSDRANFLIKVGNPDNTEDIFYFDGHGYHPPSSNKGNIWLWSSSGHLYESDQVYIFSDYFGDFELYGLSPYGDMAVRCAMDRGHEVYFPSRAGVTDCGLKECLKLRDKLNGRIKQLIINQAPKLSPVVQSADGSARFMNQQDAMAYCESQGGRLPTARELALFAQSTGAVGLIEMADHRPNDHSSIIIKARNPDGDDPFYYEDHLYQQSDGDIQYGAISLWSSSFNGTDTGDAYTLDDYRGSIGSENVGVSEYHSVRCILDMKAKKN